MTTTESPGVHEVFVGRGDLLTYLNRALDEGQTVRADDVVGAVGMGKTSLLHHLFAQRDTDAGPQEWLIDLSVYLESPPGHSSPQSSARDPDGAYDILKSLAVAVVEGISPAHADRLRSTIALADETVAKSGTPALSVSTSTSASEGSVLYNSPTSVNMRPDRSFLEAMRESAIRASGHTIVKEMVQGLNSAEIRRPLVLLLDNVDLIAGTELAPWIEAAIRGLRDTVVVMAHEPEAGIDLPDAVVKRVPIPPLTETEVADYLAERRYADPHEPDLAGLLHRCSGGVPKAVELLVDLLTDPTSGLTPADLRSDLIALAANPQGRITRLVEGMIERLHGQDAVTALKAVSITRQCDAPLLKRLLTEAGATTADPPLVMAKLEAFSFTDEYWGPTPWGRAPSGSAPAQAYFVSVHPFIATEVAEQLRRYDPGLFRRLHGVAAAYWYEQLTTTELYGSRFLYEDPAYQQAARAWVCHLARASLDTTRLREVARVYFDAFWWFGNYADLAFCDQLVEDVQAFALEMGTTKEAGLADALREFHLHYPRRSAHRRDFEPSLPSADWHALQNKLFAIQAACRVSEEPTDDEIANVVTGLTELYIAETFQNLPDGLEAGLAYYDAADSALAACERTWDRAWVAFYRADALLRHGRIEDATTSAESAAKMLAEVDDPAAPDEELAADLHRIQADITWQQGDRLSAMRDYTLAVIRAFLFHGIGGPPDAYTMQFYFEMRGRALERLVKIYEEFGDQASAALSTVTGSVPPTLPWPRPSIDEIRPALASHDLAALATALFPAGPSEAELGLENSEFMLQLLAFSRRSRHAHLPRPFAEPGAAET